MPSTLLFRPAIFVLTLVSVSLSYFARAASPFENEIGCYLGIQEMNWTALRPALKNDQLTDEEYKKELADFEKRRQLSTSPVGYFVFPESNQFMDALSTEHQDDSREAHKRFLFISRDQAVTGLMSRDFNQRYEMESEMSFEVSHQSKATTIYLRVVSNSDDPEKLPVAYFSADAGKKFEKVAVAVEKNEKKVRELLDWELPTMWSGIWKSYVTDALTAKSLGEADLKVLGNAVEACTKVKNAHLELMIKEAKEALEKLPKK